jgi:hypothetical protein
MLLGLAPSGFSNRYRGTTSHAPRSTPCQKTRRCTHPHSHADCTSSPPFLYKVIPHKYPHQSLLLTPSSLNLTSFSCFPVGFHSSNILSNPSTSLPNSFFTNSSSSSPRIAHGRKKGFGFVLVAEGSYSLTLNLYKSFTSAFSPIIGMLMPWNLPADTDFCCGGTGSDVVSSAC